MARKNPEEVDRDRAPAGVKLQRHNRAEIAQFAKNACRNLGGCANIDERYVIIDTRKFKAVGIVNDEP